MSETFSVADKVVVITGAGQGNGDPYGTLREAWSNYRDESFILQFMSPAVMRQLRLFHVRDDAEDPTMVVDGVHVLALNALQHFGKELHILPGHILIRRGRFVSQDAAG